MDFDLVSARTEVQAFMRRLEMEIEHVTQVTRLSLALFDQLCPDDSNVDRFILEAAASLHDIGWSVSPSGKGHHKESEKLIRENNWTAIPASLVPVIANIARYHRKSAPKPTHPRFAALSRDDQSRVRKLAALLRVGDALDRSHLQLVREIRCRRLPSELLLETVADDELRVEQFGIQKKSDLMADVFGLPIRLTRVREL